LRVRAAGKAGNGRTDERSEMEGSIEVKAEVKIDRSLGSRGDGSEDQIRFFQ
jgi:hypothetical protein